ncbi:MAG: Beta-barrel assembly-enhancing protease [Candidatus Anoxychlamydiales bacterium]|nr:Beta-barrel assembly-enhancing protease [Candidatus Anoxychlamydiales bacterium]
MAARIERTSATTSELPAERPSKQILLHVFDILCQTAFCELNQDQIRAYKNEISPLKDLKEESGKYLLIADKLSKIASEILKKEVRQEVRQNSFAFDIFLNSPCHKALKDLNEVYQEIFYLYFEKENIGKSIDIAKKMSTGESQEILFVKIAEYYLQKGNPEAASKIVREDLDSSFSKQEKLFTEIAEYYLQKDKPEAASKIVRKDLKSFSIREKLFTEIAGYYLKNDNPEAASKIVREDLKSFSIREKLFTEITKCYLQKGNPEAASNIVREDLKSFSIREKLFTEIAEYYLKNDKPEAAAKIVKNDLKGASSEQEKLLAEIARAFLRDGKKTQAENAANSIRSATLKKLILSEIE